MIWPGPVRSPDPVKSPDRGTLSIIETWPQNTNYLKIEHFSRLVAAELVFPQLPDIWAALSLLNIFPSRPLTPFTCIAGKTMKVSNPIVNKDIINFHFRFLFWMSAFRKVNSRSWPSHLDWILYPERDTYPWQEKTWFEKSIPNGVPMSHDVNFFRREVKIIELENHPDREISWYNVSRLGEISRLGDFTRSSDPTGPDD